MNGEQLGEAIRDACLEAAISAYEDAGIRGLCAEGRWEAAVVAIRRLPLEPIVSRASAGAEPPLRRAEGEIPQ